MEVPVYEKKPPYPAITPVKPAIVRKYGTELLTFIMLLLVPSVYPVVIAVFCVTLDCDTVTLEANCKLVIFVSSLVSVLLLFHLPVVVLYLNTSPLLIELTEKSDEAADVEDKVCHVADVLLVAISA